MWCIMFVSSLSTRFCPHCQKHVQARKQLAVWRAPEILILHLKRFGKEMIGEKLDVPVRYPVVGLDLKPMIRGPQGAADGPPMLYDLFAVAVRHVCQFCLRLYLCLLGWCVLLVVAFEVLLLMFNSCLVLRFDRTILAAFNLVITQRLVVRTVMDAGSVTTTRLFCL